VGFVHLLINILLCAVKRKTLQGPKEERSEAVKRKTLQGPNKKRSEAVKRKTLQGPKKERSEAVTYCHNKSKPESVTNGAGTVFPSGASELTHAFLWVSCTF
jgi:hypothetical protein